jgi:Domain of unknown function (DUF4129)
VRSKLRVLTLALLLAVLPIVAPGQTPTRNEIKHAIDTVEADPNLAPQKTIRTLKWVRSTDPEPPHEDSRGFLEWILELLGWFAQTARILVWVVVGLLAGLLVVFVLRLIKERSPSMGPGRRVIPTHVQDLDIRPQSLPDNIGAAARLLWDNGDQRGSLSLLYRGLLSRLVHVHRVPIRDSSTEGDTLQMTSTRLRDDKRDYVARLVQVWQRAVYGGQQPETGSLYGLCDDFATALDSV